MRLDRFLCKSTELERPQALAAIHAGDVRVNGTIIVAAATQVHENNHITLGGRALTLRPSRYLMLHKPAGTLSSNLDGRYPSLFRCLDIERAADLHLVGRLDADTTGLVLLTDDGRWSFDIISPKSRCEKLYRVGLRDPISAAERPEIVARFARGLALQGEACLTRTANLRLVHPTEALLTITEGKFHQVKRMFATVGNKVTTLHRQRIGSLDLDLMPGEWRHLSQAEVASFRPAATTVDVTISAATPIS
ncbi:pseudouridine synthase [Shewanella sp. AS16]|uniref:pseudouridine synthase n=1 Tax=Shewanella sp. AS16 TaxID=2907625 RepID=UPI001F15B20B|nr:pseudouridine synthase [Shewanella sp. AS16]MCE9687567.1 pseudouridine synthase [Shewanella sp. AS16]